MITEENNIKIKKISFKKNYNMSKYLKAQNIYSQGKVKIDNIQFLGEKDYVIKSVVQGSKCPYNVELDVHNGYVKESICSCPDDETFCKHILATCMEAIDPHTEEIDAGIMQENNTYLQTVNNSFGIQKWYQNIKLSRENREKLHTNIQIEPRIYIKYNQDIVVEFYLISENNSYPLKDFNAFVDAFSDNTVVTLNRNFKFKAEKESFNIKDHILLAYILSYVENKKQARGIYSTSRIREFSLSKSDIDGLFTVLRNRDVYVNLSSKYNQYKKYKVTTSPFCPIFDVTTRTKTENTEFEWDISPFKVISSNANMHIISENKIYTAAKSTGIDTLFRIFKNTNKVVVTKEKLEMSSDNQITSKDKFFYEIFTTFDLGFKIDTVQANMYIDLNDNKSITLRLTFTYGNKEYNILSQDYEESLESLGIKRDRALEKQIKSRLFKDNFEIIPDTDFFILSEIQDIYKFITQSMSIYKREFNVFVTEKASKVKPKEVEIERIGVKLKNNLLELDLSKIDIPLEELQDILQSYRLKNRYYMLKSGDLLDIVEGKLKVLLDAANSPDIDFANIQER